MKNPIVNNPTKTDRLTKMILAIPDYHRSKGITEIGVCLDLKMDQMYIYEKFDKNFLVDSFGVVYMRELVRPETFNNQFEILYREKV